MDKMSDKIISRKVALLESIALVVFGYFAFSVADLCSKKLQESYSIYQVLGTSSSIGLIITSLWLFIGYGKRAFFPANLKLHLIRALMVLGTAYFMVRSLQTLPLADFYGIIFIVPFLVMILAVALLKETIGWRRWMAAVVGFLGIVVLAGPQFDHIGEGIVCALIGAFCAACNIIALRKIGAKGPVPLYGVYAFAAIAGFNLSMMVATGVFKPYAVEYLPYFLIHGPIVILGILGTSMGFAKAPEAVVVAPFQYTQIIWGVLFGWFFFQALPTANTWIGLALVIGAGLYSLWREYRRAHHLD